MPKTVDKSDLVVAKRVGSNLYLAGEHSRPTYEPLSERTMFFQQTHVDEELKRIRVDLADVTIRPAEFHAVVG